MFLLCNASIAKKRDVIDDAALFENQRECVILNEDVAPFVRCFFFVNALITKKRDVIGDAALFENQRECVILNEDVAPFVRCLQKHRHNRYGRHGQHRAEENPF